MLTPQQLETICAPNIAHCANYVDALNKTFDMYQINTPLRQASFLGQIITESQYFNAVVENLNYSMSGLLSTFPHTFNATTAQQYAHNPEMIANKVYASKYGNGNEASGDGWRYRGRGLIQITFKGNYILLAHSLQKTLDETTTYLETIEGAAVSAGWFWNYHGLNDFADKLDNASITKVINPSMRNLQNRINFFNIAQKVLLST